MDLRNLRTWGWEKSIGGNAADPTRPLGQEITNNNARVSMRIKFISIEVTEMIERMS